MNPAFVSVSVLNMNPKALAFENFKWDTLFNRIQYIIIGARTGPNIAVFGFCDYGFYIADKGFMYPTLVALKVSKVIPPLGGFKNKNRMVFFHLPQDVVTGCRSGTNIGHRGRNCQPLSLCKICTQKRQKDKNR